MRERRLPSDIRHDVTSYYADIWIPSAGEQHVGRCLLHVPKLMRHDGSCLHDLLAGSPDIKTTTPFPSDAV